MTVPENFVQPLRQKLVSHCGFEVDPEDKNGLYKTLNDHFFMVFYHSVDEIPKLGFWHGNDKAFSPTQKSKLTDILKREEFDNCLKGDFCDWGAEWIIKEINTDDYKNNYVELVDIIIKRYELLQMVVEATKF
jgi:hypothetical protein